VELKIQHTRINTTATATAAKEKEETAAAAAGTEGQATNVDPAPEAAVEPATGSGLLGLNSIEQLPAPAKNPGLGPFTNAEDLINQIKNETDPKLIVKKSQYLDVMFPGSKDDNLVGQIAMAYSSLGRYEEAMEEITNWKEQVVLDDQAKEYFDGIEVEISNKAEKAQVAQVARAENTPEAQATRYQNLAISASNLVDRGDFGRAASVYEQMNKLKPNVDLGLNVARYYTEGKLWDKALKAIQELKLQAAASSSSLGYQGALQISSAIRELELRVQSEIEKMPSPIESLPED